jgi:hypothetical protein
MEKLLGRKINFFDGIYGKNVDLNNLFVFDKNLTLNFLYKANFNSRLSKLTLKKTLSI